METSSGTGNIGVSARNCDKRRGVPSGQKQKQLTMDQAVSKYSPALHRAILAMRTSVSNRPFNALEDKYYRQEVELLWPGTKLPHRTVVSKDVKYLHTTVVSDYIRWLVIWVPSDFRASRMLKGSERCALAILRELS
ncbi:hypothetical protein AURDEDRAFT_68674 [Auricularia subglabra TFB-10046 SS5]|nr:hypothetical protein AURDEDRAFT_68674 [Auricularia subglabra TFB-10046 SS5]